MSRQIRRQIPQKQKKKRVDRNACLLVFILIFSGILTFLLLTARDNSKLNSTLDETFDFVKNRIESYEIYNTNDQVKSLVRLLDKTTELSRVIEQEGNLSTEMLDEYAREQRLTGILVLDQNQKVTEQTAKDGDDLRFYGFDMQRWSYNLQYLIEACEKAGIDVTELKKLEDTEEQHSEYDVEQQSRVITEIKEELQKSDVKDIVQADHLADTLLQNISLGKVINSAVEGNVLRDQLMAENVLWILSMEEQRGNSCIFISGHNGHIERSGNYGTDNRVMGNILSDELGEGYFAIGTDFYKTNCNLPKNDGKRITHTFYSYDPLAKAAKKTGYDMSWLDFSKVPENSQLKEQITDHVSMGSLGEGYSAFFMSIFPQSYRVSQSPEKLYDGMIFVTDAHPIEIREEISEK